MGEDPGCRLDGVKLLQQLETILEYDDLIDEVGFIHPSQFASLNEDSGRMLRPDMIINKSADENMNKEFRDLPYDTKIFWHNNHKLGISTQVLPQLYTASLHAFMDVSRRHKLIMKLPAETDSSEKALPADSSYHFLENEILRHTRAVLLLSSDLMSAWNLRKLVLSKKLNLSLLMKEFLLSDLILSHSPKSECTWAHRRWVIKTIAKRFQNIHEMIERESELVERIAEVYISSGYGNRMNYRAWNHRCWVIRYMTRVQVLDELQKCRRWTELHVADNCCFHYRRALFIKVLEEVLQEQDGEASSRKSEVYSLWKEELEWNKLLIQRYLGREALWIHRRFLSQCWIKYFASNDKVLCLNNEDHPALDIFVSKELELFHNSMNASADEFEDSHLQAQHAASYILWLSKIPLHSNTNLLERLKEMGGLKDILTKTFPEKTHLLEMI